MAEPIINQPWEDVADDVTGAIEKAVQPLLKKAVDDIYGGLLDATQDYLKDNLAFNIASRIDAAEREAAAARQQCSEMSSAMDELLAAVIQYRDDLRHAIDEDSRQRRLAMVEALISKATSRQPEGERAARQTTDREGGK